MQEVNNEIKELRFRFPMGDYIGFGRKLSCLAAGQTTWAASFMETSQGSTIIVVRDDHSGERQSIQLPLGAHYHRPHLFDLHDGFLGLIWNAYEAGTWAVKYARLNAQTLAPDPVETVFASTRLCLPPTGAIAAQGPVIAWPAIVEGDTRILLAHRSSGVWCIQEPLSEKGIDAFRPCIAVSDGAPCVVWDQYRNGRYEIAGALLTSSARRMIRATGQVGERWFCPEIVCTPKNELYLTWVVQREVSDANGIADHHAFGMVAKVCGDAIVALEDPMNPQDPRIIADLREGLLASNVSKGYLGLRRNPALSVSSEGKVWCLWEVRIEDEKTAVSGHLAGRVLDGETWSSPSFFCNAGYGYAPARNFEKASLQVAYFKFAQTGTNILATDQIALTEKRSHVIDPSKWIRWQDSDIRPLAKSKRTVQVDGESLSMFWADTHCHSNFSADAEGEQDELIHYARDLAGLDALCLIDNDFYPHKTLSPAEWQIHQEWSRHFTQHGKFVLFAGYEFTYHRKDLSPDFNHRCVIYPGAGGEMYRRIDADTKSERKLMAKLEGTSAMCYPHHCTYELTDPQREWNVEVCSSWRVVLEECDYSIRQLCAGRKFGFIGSSDAHRSNPGLGGAITGVFAPDLTPQALFDAYRARRLVATQGFAAFIDFRVGGIFIGGEGHATQSPLITANIEAPDAIEYVRVLRDGKEIYRVTPGSHVCDFSFRDDSARKGPHFYFLNLKLVGDPGYNIDPSENARRPFSLNSRFPHNLAKARGVFAWTSPIWLEMQ